jgi:hypothetical protein
LAKAASNLSPTRASGTGSNLLGTSATYFIPAQCPINRKRHGHHKKAVREIEDWEIKRNLNEVNHVTVEEGWWL